MQPIQLEVAVLKPTSVFLSFLSSQLPEIELPDLRTLRQDNTAYILEKQPNDEETLNEIERHFPLMFRHEIARWLGKNADNKIEGTFLDFLCCFKFELHSQIVLMEEALTPGQSILRIRPRSVLLKWIKSTVSEQSDLFCVLEKINLSHLAENATVIIKNFNDTLEIRSFLKEYYPCIFEAEMLRMCEDSVQWPDMDSYQTFNRYFSVDLHTQLVPLFCP